MNTIEKEILKKLRCKLLQTSSLTEAEFMKEAEASTSNCIYYLRDFKDNIKTCKNRLNDYSNKDKKPNRWDVIPMAALRSSAALTYNIFGDNDKCSLKFDASDVFKNLNLISDNYWLKYEWKHRTINNAKANLDAYLHLENYHLFVETKMLEPLTKSHPFDQEAYEKYTDEKNCPSKFISAFKFFKTHKPEYYDAFQMLKHLLAIYNYFKERSFDKCQYVVLLNCHWEPKDQTVGDISLEKIYKKFGETAALFEGMQICFQELFNKVNVNLILAHCDHRELIKIVGKGNDKYLERYEI